MIGRRGFLKAMVAAVAAPQMLMSPAPAAAAVTNAELFDRLAARRKAIDAINEWTRTKIREDGVYRQIMGVSPIQ